MTNSPEFNWHIQNLRQYIGLKSQPFAPTQWGDVPLSAFGQSMGLPGDFTPPSRFVRTAYGKQNIQGIDNEEEGVLAIFHILSNSEVPKGGVIYEDVKEELLDNLYPFANDFFGNFLCFDYRKNSTSPTIVFWYHEEEDMEKQYILFT